MGPAGTQTDNLETEIMTVDMVTHIYNPSIQGQEDQKFKASQGFKH